MYVLRIVIYYNDYSTKMIEEAFRDYEDAKNRMNVLARTYIRLLNNGKIKHYYIVIEED